MRPIHHIWFTHFWFQFLVYPRRNVPLTEIGETQEAGYPWRVGRCRVFRLPLTRRAVAVGKWTSYIRREQVEGFTTITMRELPNWEDYTSRVQPDDESRLAG
jgi:hypothetical protein